MGAEVLIGDGDAAYLTPHPLRAAILGEVHARPFTPISVPSRIVHFAFDTSGARAQTDRANLVAFCESRGLAAPSPAEKHHRAPFGTTILRWEQHSEFTTYTWEVPSDPAAFPFHPDAASLASPMRLVPQPGPLLVAVDLHLLGDFDQAPLGSRDRRRQALRFRQTQQRERAIGFQLDHALHQRAGPLRRHVAVGDKDAHKA